MAVDGVKEQAGLIRRAPARPPGGARKAFALPSRAALAGSFVVWALAYLAGVTLGEVLTTYVDPRLGMLTHCLLLLALVVHAGRNPSGRNPSGRADVSGERAFLVSMAFAPLIRILSLALPLTGFPLLYWYLIISVPLFVTLYVAAHSLGLSWRALGLNLRKPCLQGLIALTGIAFGTMEYLILRPEPLVGAFTFAELWWPALVLLISTGLLEEMIFRGLLQETGAAPLGRWVLLYVGVLFAVLHIGYRSVVDLVFVLIVGTFFGWVTARTRSLVGVTLAHGLTNIVLFLVMPFVALQLGDAPQVALARLAGAVPQRLEAVLGATKEPGTEATPQSAEAPPTRTPLVLSATPVASRTPAPTATPTPRSTPTPTPAPSATPAPSRTPTPTATPSATPAPSRTPTPTPTATPSATPTPSRTPTATPSATPALVLFPTAEPAEGVGSPVATPTLPVTPTVALTGTATLTPTATVACWGGALALEAYPIDRYTTPDGWAALIYANATGGDCMYTYTWNLESEVVAAGVSGPVVFEVRSSQREAVIVGTVLVTSADVTVRTGVYITPPD